MRFEIRGHHFPGRKQNFGGKPCDNLHVGIQLGHQPAELVPGDAEQATWSTEIDIVDRDGSRDFRGPAVQGKRGERFVYLTWGDLGTDGTFAMVGRVKLMLDDVLPSGDPNGRVIATVDLTDERGGPRFARLRAPAITVSAG